MKKENIHNIGLNIDTQKKVYAFLSKTIYDELIEYGVDDEYIFPFLLYLHWVIVRQYCQVSQNDNIYNTEKVLRHIENSPESGKETPIQNLPAFIDAFLADNEETLISIYRDVYQAGTTPAWLRKWESLCESCYNTNKFRIQTCLTLLRIVNECLNESFNTTNISLNILLKIQKKQKNIILLGKEL